MVEFYHEIRLTHITAVLASGSLFFARGLVLFAGGQWALSAPLRYLSYTIDTVLLTAALMLMTIVRQYPGADAWLTMKVSLVVLYIALGYYALARARTRTLSVGLWLAALAVFAAIYSIARAHHPLGAFAGLA